MSQQALAGSARRDLQQVQKDEKGVNRIAASRLFDITAALDMPIARLFEGLAPGGKPGANLAPAEQVGATPEGAQLLALFALFASIASVKARRRVVELVRARAHVKV